MSGFPSVDSNASSYDERLTSDDKQSLTPSEASYDSPLQDCDADVSTSVVDPLAASATATNSTVPVAQPGSPPRAASPVPSIAVSRATHDHLVIPALGPDVSAVHIDSWITDTKKLALDCKCTNPAHGNCVLTRTVRWAASGPSGRPLGLLAAWGERCIYFANRADHVADSKSAPKSGPCSCEGTLGSQTRSAALAWP